MATLEEFLPSRGFSLQDFTINPPLIPVTNPRTNKNMAAHIAAVSGDPESVESTYLSIVGDLDSYGESEMGEALQERAKEFSYSQERNALVEILTDPEISDEQKREASNQFLDRTNQSFSDNYTLSKIISENTLAEPSDYESAESESVRIGFADQLDAVDDYRQWVQSLVNQQAALSDSSLAESVGDFLELMVPFAEGGQVARIRKQLDDGNLVGALGDMVLFGSAKGKIRDGLRAMPLEDKQRLAQSIVDIVNSEAGILLANENDMARMLQIRSFLEEGFYDDTDVWIDNVIGILDATILGKPLSNLITSFRAGRRLPPLEGDYIPGGPSPTGPSGPGLDRGVIEGEFSDVTRRSVETNVQPATLSQVYRNTNPGKARDAHDVAARDTSGEAAEALYGTSRTEAIAHDLLPQVATETGRVTAKVSRPNAREIDRITPSPEVMDIVREDGGIQYWRQEKERFDSRVFNDFHNAFGLTARPEMFQYGRDGVEATVKAVYGPMDSGWSNAQDALDLTAFNLRHYGVTEDQLTLLMRDGDNYVPVSIDEIPAGSTDFLVQVETPIRMDSSKVETWEAEDVLRNWFDSFEMFAGESQGSFQRHLLDAHSMLHPQMTLGANVAVDKANALEKALLDTLKPFTDIYTKLPKDRQQIVERIIKEANYNSRVPSYTELVAKGLSREEIDSLGKWKEYWDTQWWLENQDLKRSLSGRGYMVLESPGTDTMVYARPLSRNRAPAHARVYDERTGELVNLTREQVAELYESGGTLATLRQPLRVGDEVSDLVVSREVPGESYLRAFNEDDAVLNYREGYYQVFYDAPRYIDEIVRDSSGNELYRRAVATAGNTRDADLMVRRMESTTGKAGDFVQREGRERMNMGGDDYWNLQLSSGRSPQRVRGERLESASSVENLALDHNFVLEPGEAAVAAARSVSRRVRMRDYLEAAKSRFLANHSHVLPTDQYGRPRYPNRLSEIAKKEGSQRDKDVRDARTIYEYINSLENGYINAVDEGYKALMRGMADIAGRKGLAKGEEALHYLADSRGPMQLGRNTAFTLYLALNPIRQALVQSHQAVQLAANFPIYASTRMVPDTAMLIQMKLSQRAGGEWAKFLDAPTRKLVEGAGRSIEEAVFMAKAFDRSGLSASIDKQNLVKGSLTEFVEYANYTGSVAGKALKPLEWVRKIGFDAGENINMMTSWLAHYNRRLDDTGKRWDQLDSEDLDWITAKARSYTYSMNLAGEMPYNQNFLSMQFQFIQVPHKAFTQMFTDRTLTRAERARLVAFNATMYGVPASSLMYPWVEKSLPEEGELRELVLQGLEAYTFNKALSLATGEETLLDYSGLAPADTTALWDMMAAFITTDVGTIVAESPSGSLFFGGNPRITEFFKTIARYGNFVDDIEDPVTMKRIAKDMASLSSGMSNFFKARYIMKTGQKISSSGQVLVEDAGWGEALGVLFGFQTREEANGWYISQAAYEATQEFQDDVREYWKILTRHLTAEGVDQGSEEWTRRVVQDMQRVWEDSPEAKRIILGEMQRSLNQGDARMFQSFMRLMPIMDPAEVRHLARSLPDGDLRDTILRTLDGIDSVEDTLFEE